MNRPAEKIDFDSERAQAFAERLLKALNDGALCLMISIGHRTGLFDSMSRLPPSSRRARMARRDDDGGRHDRRPRDAALFAAR